jgi:hypothetical protein
MFFKEVGTNPVLLAALQYCFNSTATERLKIRRIFSPITVGGGKSTLHYKAISKNFDIALAWLGKAPYTAAL